MGANVDLSIDVAAIMSLRFSIAVSVRIGM